MMEVAIRFRGIKHLDQRGKCEFCKHYDPVVKSRMTRVETIVTVFARGGCTVKGERVYKQRNEHCKKFESRWS